MQLLADFAMLTSRRVGPYQYTIYSNAYIHTREERVKAAKGCQRNALPFILAHIMVVGIDYMQLAK